MKLQDIIQQYAANATTIAPERKVLLDKISDYILEKHQLQEKANLTYICTHNSRRSQFGQVWAQVMANHFELHFIETFSGGTEVTRCHQNTVKALEKNGFTSKELDTTDNPKIQLQSNEDGSTLWSKIYDDPANPQEGFCAILTCSEADQACPYVAGAALRVPTPYQDPKIADGLPNESDSYLAASEIIGTESWYVMNRTKEMILSR